MYKCKVCKEYTGSYFVMCSLRLFSESVVPLELTMLTVHKKITFMIRMTLKEHPVYLTVYILDTLNQFHKCMYTGMLVCHIKVVVQLYTICLWIELKCMCTSLLIATAIVKQLTFYHLQHKQ